MPDQEPAIWGIHAGRTGDAESLFFKQNVVAVGWTEMGDLSKLPANREAFKEAVTSAYPDPGLFTKEQNRTKKSVSGPCFQGNC